MNSLIKKTMIAGVCLFGLAGCSCEPDIPDWYNTNHSLGITLSELVEEMNQIDETLNLDLSTLDRYPVEIADSPSKIGLLNEGVFAEFSVSTFDEDPTEKVTHFFLVYDQTNPEATHYVTKFIQNFNRLGLNGVFKSSDMSRYGIEFTSRLEDYEGVEPDEQTLTLLEESGLLESESLGIIQMFTCY